MPTLSAEIGVNHMMKSTRGLVLQRSLDYTQRHMTPWRSEAVAIFHTVGRMILSWGVYCSVRRQKLLREEGNLVGVCGYPESTRFHTTNRSRSLITYQ